MFIVILLWKGYHRKSQALLYVGLSASHKQLSSIDTTVLSRPTSLNAAVTNNVTNAQPVFNDSPDTMFLLNKSQSFGMGCEPCAIANSGFLLTTIDTTGFRPTGSTHVGPLASTPSKRAHYNIFQRMLPSEGSPSKSSRSSTLRVRNRRLPKFTCVSYMYNDLRDCDHQCHHCGAAFQFSERLKGHSNSHRPEYHLCYGGGKFYMEPNPDPPEYIKRLLQNRHFMENIRAYNQMFRMTSFGAKIDEAINNERWPYIFKVSGQVYHWI
ncbi:helitron helicase-like domain-containing protein [Tanacetum coccineum]|uniref:Helitron helicase-like domain-containing protein n=1 Tax=Tanacetum coccineum TaxID=301880 RepID=A0ABQ4ZX14_9ASTR